MLKDLFSRLFSSPKTPSHFYTVYVRCDQCGEKIATHINMQNDLSIQYGQTDKENVYFVRKRLLGDARCFQAIDVEMTFDQKHNLLDQKISGGQFITEKEFSGENGGD